MTGRRVANTVGTGASATTRTTTTNRRRSSVEPISRGGRHAAGSASRWSVRPHPAQTCRFESALSPWERVFTPPAPRRRRVGRVRGRPPLASPRGPPLRWSPWAGVEKLLLELLSAHRGTMGLLGGLMPRNRRRAHGRRAAFTKRGQAFVFMRRRLIKDLVANALICPTIGTIGHRRTCAHSNNTGNDKSTVNRHVSSPLGFHKT